MSTSRTYAAYTNYLALIKSAVAGTVAVYDGPQVTMPTNQEYIILGSVDPLIDGFQTSIDAGQQDWLDLGAMNRWEEFQIPAVHVVWSGDNDLSVLRAASALTIGQIETALRPPPAGTGDGQLNGALAPTGWCGVAVTALQQLQESNGAVLHTPFVLQCKTRI